jgi:cytochrome c
MNWKSVCMAAAAAWVLSAAGASAGDAAAGETLFNQKCKTCHRIGEGAANAVGPELNGVIGRTAGSVSGYAYSDALKASGITWGEATLKEFLTNPRAKVAGTKMVFAGLPKDTDRDNLVAYISQFDASGAKK